MTLRTALRPGTEKDYTLGATNLIYLDASDEGCYQSPHEIADERWAEGDAITRYPQPSMHR